MPLGHPIVHFTDVITLCLTVTLDKWVATLISEVNWIDSRVCTTIYLISGGMRTTDFPWVQIVNHDQVRVLKIIIAFQREQWFKRNSDYTQYKTLLHLRRTQITLKMQRLGVRGGAEKLKWCLPGLASMSFYENSGLMQSGRSNHKSATVHKNKILRVISKGHCEGAVTHSASSKNFHLHTYLIATDFELHSVLPDYVTHGSTHLPLIAINTILLRLR